MRSTLTVGKKTGRRKMLALAFALVGLMVFVAACGGDDDSNGGDGEALSTTLVMPCTESDPFCAAGQEAATTLEEDGQVTLDVITGAPQDTAGITQVLERVAGEGQEVILAHSAWQDPSLDVGQSFPDVNIAYAGGGETGENVATYDEPIYQAAYLAGMIGAGISESGTLGGLGAVDIPLCHAELEAFEEGAARIDKNIEVIDTYVGDFNDVPRSRQAALGQVDQGADVLIACGGAAANAMAEVVKQEDISGFDYVSSIASQAPENIVGTVTWDLAPYFERIVEDINGDTFRPGQAYDIGVAEGGVRLDLNDQYSAAEIPADVTDEVENVQQQIEDEEFEVPFIPEGEGKTG
ncbi:MAG: BMP family lipoprotein [Gaiellaceae bacterium]